MQLKTQTPYARPLSRPLTSRELQDRARSLGIKWKRMPPHELARTVGRVEKSRARVWAV